MKDGTYWDEVWNPTAGCSRVSEGCRNCWAEKFAWRHANNPKQKAVYGPTATAKGWTGHVTLRPERLELPLKWRKPRVVSVQFMGDLFADGVPDEYLVAVFAVMAAAEEHTFLLLTKRPERMRAFLADKTYWPERFVASANMWAAADYGVDVSGFPDFHSWPLPNVWLGTSVEDQRTAGERIPHLLDCPAAGRFVSAEPLLDDAFTCCHCDGRGGFLGAEYGFVCCPECGGGGYVWLEELDAVIVGGESGPGARPCNVEWLRSTVEQCSESGVPCFVKQLGAHYVDAASGVGGAQARPDPSVVPPIRHLKDRAGADMSEWPEDIRVRELPWM